MLPDVFTGIVAEIEFLLVDSARQIVHERPFQAGVAGNVGGDVQLHQSERSGGVLEVRLIGVVGRFEDLHVDFVGVDPVQVEMEGRGSDGFQSYFIIYDFVLGLML